MSLRMRDTVPADIGATTAGPLLIGYFLNWGLLGVLTIQVFLYYIAFPNDKTSMKALVYALFCLDLAQTLILTHDAFFKFGLQFSDVQQLVQIKTFWLSVPTISAITGTAVQLFFAYRLSSLSGSKLVGIVIASLALASGGTGIAQGVLAKVVGSLEDLAIKTRNPLTIWLSVSAACDVLIALSMTYFLSKKRSGLKTSTDDAVTRIIRLTVETGTLTAILAVLTVILFTVWPHASYWDISCDIIGKVYNNNLLLILNRRISIVGGRNDCPSRHPYDQTHFGLSFIQDEESSSRSVGPSRRAHSMHNMTKENLPPIRIHKEVYTSNDYGLKMEPALDPARE